MSSGVTLCAKNLFRCTSIYTDWRKNAHDKVRRKLPNILSREEVARLIEAWSSLFEPTLLMVLFGTGKSYQHELTAAAGY